MGFDDRSDIDLETVKNNYKKLVVRFHPDKLGKGGESE
jgi:curved DNA-binding protein CbpA